MIITRSWTRQRDARAVPGAYFDEAERAWMLDLDQADSHARMVLVRLFPNLAREVPLSDAGQDIRPPLLSEGYVNPDSPVHDLPWVDRLHGYQTQDLVYLVDRLQQDGGAYLGWDRGLGKTLGAITVAKAIDANTTIVVAPNSSKLTVWEPEYRKWDDSDALHNFGGTARRRMQAYNTWRYETGGILLVHYEALRLLPKGTEADLVVVDEAHRLANGSSSHKAPQFYKALMKVDTRYKLALSGSIMVNSPEDIFGALHWLFPNLYSAKWRDWNNRFMHYVEGDHGQVFVGVRPDKAEELRRELATIMCVRYKDDTLDMPELVEQTLHVDLSPQQRKVYDDLAVQFMATLPDGDVVVTPTILAQLAKMRQVSTGLDLVGSVSDSTKFDLAEDLINDSTGKTVCFVWHRAAADAIAARFGGGAVVVHGGVAEADRALALERFRTDPGVRVLCATIRTMGESVNLQCAQNVIFIESSWVPSDMEQARDRVYRQGQEHRVTVTNIVARDTLDETSVIPTVMTKAALRRMTLGGS